MVYLLAPKSEENKNTMTVRDASVHACTHAGMHACTCTYPEVVEGEVGQAHASDVFRQLFQHLRVLCLQSPAEKRQPLLLWEIQRIEFVFK